MHYDLIIAGAGPAGSAAAITAARSGVKVLLLERGRFPRPKVCGEFVSAESLELLEHLLAPECRSLMVRALRIPQGRIFADGSEIRAEINPPAASITRFELDDALWKSALQSGVDAREQVTVTDIEGSGPFTVRTDGESLEGKAVVNAAGRWSNLTSPQIRQSHQPDRWIGLKAHFREAHPPASVDLYFFAGGYCGVQPVSQQNRSAAVNACAMVKVQAATTLLEVLSLHPALKERASQWQRLTDAVSTSPLIFHEPNPVQDWLVQIGDAATFVDPFVGDGISLALRSGALAAQCLGRFLDGRGTLEEALDDYRINYQRRLAQVFRASSILRKLLAWPAIVRRPALAILENTPTLAQRLVRMTR
jgi:menaquinone-9 beta-reductase